MAHKTGVERYLYVVNEAPKVKNWFSNREKALFHHHNPNGVRQEYRKADDKILELSKAGKIQSGWLLAYDDDYYYRELSKLAHDRKRVKEIEVNVIVDSYREMTEKIWERLETKGLI